VAVAAAQLPQPTPSQLKLTTSSTVKPGGTKKKPKPVAITSLLDTSTADGTRQETFSELDVAWAGVKSQGQYFPTCTAAQIDAQQSDSVCPKGSLIATGKLTALVGPEADFSNPGAKCEKDVRLYNAGKNKVTNILVGDPSKCAGVGYLAPWTLTWTKKGGIQGGQMLKNPIPTNISHPLPGVLGSTVHLETDYKKLTTKVKGKKVGYLVSIGCKGKRTGLTNIVTDPSGAHLTDSQPAGKC
jgi:hypothetical protein